MIRHWLVIYSFFCIHVRHHNYHRNLQISFSNEFPWHWKLNYTETYWRIDFKLEIMLFIKRLQRLLANVPVANGQISRWFLNNLTGALNDYNIWLMHLVSLFFMYRNNSKLQVQSNFLEICFQPYFFYCLWIQRGSRNDSNIVIILSAI